MVPPITIGGSGCLLTCLAMIAPGGGVTPGQLDTILSGPGYEFIDDNGNLDVEGVVKDYFGFVSYFVYNQDLLSEIDINETIIDYMKSGFIMIAHVESRTGSAAGHFILITGQGLDELGFCHILVADPAGSSYPVLDQYVLNDLRIMYPGAAITTPTITPTPVPTGFTD